MNQIELNNQKMNCNKINNTKHNENIIVCNFIKIKEC